MAIACLLAAVGVITALLAATAVLLLRRAPWTTADAGRPLAIG